jgi:heterodisulfide reductase subunit B
MKRYLYYPGCSLKGSGRAYEESLLAVFDALEVELKELDDWNCCGATAYMSIDEAEAHVLAGRNIALASRDGADLVAPCSACYLVLNKSMRYVDEYPQLGKKVRGALREAGLTCENPVKVRHPLDVLVHDIGLDAIAKRTTAPLKGLKVAPFYGCQIVRPYATFDDQLVPETMDQLLAAAGAEVVPYPQDRASGRRVLEPMPVVHFTQLLGLAFGLSAKSVGLSRNVVPFEPDPARRAAHVA